MDKQATTHDVATPEVIMRETIRDFIREFAYLNLELVRQARVAGMVNTTPELLRELRENAQVLRNLV